MTSPTVPLKKNPYTILFNMNITGDYTGTTKFLPNMINPNLNLSKNNKEYLKIYFLPTIPLSDNLLKKANIYTDPRKVFVSITDFLELVRYTATINRPKLSLSEAKDKGITKKNIQYIKNLYFKRDEDFYINDYVYKINKAIITNTDEALTPKEDNLYKLNLNVSLLDSKKNLQKIDYFKLDCNDRAKLLDEQAEILFGINLNLFKEIAPLPKRQTPIMYTGDKGSLSNKVNPKINNNRYPSSSYPYLLNYLPNNTQNNIQNNIPNKMQNNNSKDKNVASTINQPVAIDRIWLQQPKSLETPNPKPTKGGYKSKKHKKTHKKKHKKTKRTRL